MLDRKRIEKLGGWEGYRVERIAWPEDGSRTVTIHLKPVARTMRCEHCGTRCRQVHETTVRRVRDLSMMALTLFAHRLKAYLHGILSRCRHALKTGIFEGINNTIKVIKRRAYGYRDQEYFLLKIRAAFPGIPR